MAVVENASNQDAAAAAVASNDQDQSKQNHVRSRIDPSLHQNDQGLYNKIGGPLHRSNGGDLQRSNGGGGGEVGDSFKRDMRELQELFSKLNPMAEEFVPHSLANHGLNGGFYTDNSFLHDNNNITRNGHANGNGAGRRKKNFSQGKRRMNSRTSMAQREEIIRRTVYVSENEDERQMCARTIYCTNIDKKVTQTDVKLFFETVCGEVYRLRLLGDYHHSTRIAFVEFVMAESAIAALNCSGVVLGSLPIRVSPSKTPVRPRAPRIPMH
ncbi:CTC-interacting domain 11 isoform 3 [Theobroma cacao]|uniref:CTC-interacting domain 11 isoform 3 n=1 Tax=Theobroma cacao TaxID=3641 RepID=A0A061G3T4_THECC|nr:CTC-interacting domain 11 isoform 3 [Theobroma cacao]EOY23861.1 CTC-interacting domain 11 isoform 3 [Theobroma cacao]EOY23862.1 CTC-interacting domain 11 isoform 3 [Theobroma cacao]